MIKIKLSDPDDIKSFSGLILSKDILPNYSIELTTSNDYDYELISQRRFLNSSVPLQESINNGLEYLSKITGDYFLISGADSTSLTGVYEVFSQSNAQYLFKKQILSQNDYKEKTTLNKWFFGNGSLLDKGYDIPDDVYNRIKLTGYNVAHNWPHLQQTHNGNPVRDIDVCAVYQGILNNGNMDHEVRSDILYTNHRKGAWDKLSEIENKYNIIKGQSSPQQFIEIMKRSKIGLSPFGMGELCYRDIELVQWGCLLLKPDISKVITAPNFFKPMETYVPVKPDWSDLNEVIQDILENFKNYEHIIENSRKQLVEMYSYHNVCLHWYNFFSQLNSTESA